MGKSMQYCVQSEYSYLGLRDCGVSPDVLYSYRIFPVAGQRLVLGRGGVTAGDGVWSTVDGDWKHAVHAEACEGF